MTDATGGGDRTVDVEILGETYSLKTETGADYTRQVAAHVDQMAREIREESGVLDQAKLAILTALAVTDQLFRMREGVDRVKAVAEKRAERLTADILQVVDGGPEA